MATERRSGPPLAGQGGRAEWLLPPEVERRGAALLDQQMWCWGQDVRRPEGNALLRYGLERHPPPEGERGASAYSGQAGPGCRVVLWAFGLFYGDDDAGGLYLRRYALAPTWAPAAELPLPLWDPEQLPPSRPPRGAEERARVRVLLSGALAWVAGYERWAIGALGPEHRERCVAAWPRAVVPAGDMAEAWAALAEACRDGLGGRE
jgi:hypothetical protein